MGNRFLIWLAYLTLSVILLSLSHWQWQRADEKKALLKAEITATQLEPVNIADLVSDDNLSAIRYRAVRLTGHYDNEHQFLVDNQIVKGKVGYFVLTPFMIKGLNKAVLVNRGWVPLMASRTVLPDVSLHTEQESIDGRINHFPSIGIELSDAAKPSEHWPSLVQVVHSDVLSAKLGYSLLPFQIELNPLQTNGYVREWRMTTLLSPEQHIAYSLQWLGLAVTLTVLFAWYSFKSHYGRSTKKE